MRTKPLAIGDMVEVVRGFRRLEKGKVHRVTGCDRTNNVVMVDGVDGWWHVERFVLVRRHVGEQEIAELNVVLWLCQVRWVLPVDEDVRLAYTMLDEYKRFGAECQAEEYTDTSELWIITDALVEVIERLLHPKVRAQ